MAPSRRLELAKTLAGELQKREGRNLVAVGVYGSVARGEERAHSDVDMLVVVRRRRPAIQHLVRDGVLITVLQQTPQEARAEVTGSRPDLNAALGGWRSLKPLYDPSGLLQGLVKRSNHPTGAQFREAARQALIETYEDLGKVRNAVAVRDKEEAREMAIWYSGAAAGALLDLHRHVLRTGRRAFIEIRRYGAVGEAIRRLSHETLSLADTRRLAESSWADLLALARRKRVRLPKFAGARGSL
jgi:kanamycin nucleotidyltransferase